MNTVNSEFERQKRRKRAVKKGVMVLKYAALAVASFIVLMPILWFMTSSFRSNNEVFANINPFSLREMFFGTYSLENYRTIFVKYNFARTVGNTLLVCFLTITIGIFVCSMAGYALAKMEFKGKRIMMMLVLFSIMIPFDAIAIPLYSIIMKLRWIDTYKAVILPAVANGMTIFLFRQSFVDIDNSLLESARMDGAGEFRTYLQIVMPVSIPTIISGALVMFTAQWNAFMWPLLVARSDKLKMLQVALADFQLENGTMWAELFAGITISMVIPCVILIPFQKYYIRGIASSGTKG
ncbi:carbohydrate ABC transporter permease [Clostridium sp. AF18-27]|uniref:carbohydrate ABC transporter permease n=1 Tax=Enterocloster lavalensis TaxID=460384 RepID=UPI000D1B0E44|nr:carbohydrate ABC transporter permease [Enterocloster lavalensis]MBS5603846.1 carbohydrate ABC transporter permease [Enterocloster asparagiformis]MCB6343816.1 carbohydrate ABC transporter permease [Enterocloster lavalensis]PST33829.1 ABC transporter permease [Enterocloster lavalensis]RHR44561.1 carbohydrate ABC transporter permease [Clostridium sp. AF18-27]